MEESITNIDQLVLKSNKLKIISFLKFNVVFEALPAVAADYFHFQHSRSVEDDYLRLVHLASGYFLDLWALPLALVLPYLLWLNLMSMT